MQSTRLEHKLNLCPSVDGDAKMLARFFWDEGNDRCDERCQLQGDWNHLGDGFLHMLWGLS